MRLEPHTRKPVVGLIGAIGAGKSTAAAAFAARGGAVVDADKLGHAALEDLSAKEAVVARWGCEVLRADGTVDRRVVGRIVFADPAERAGLESIVFPVIRRLASAAIVRAQADPVVRFVVLDAAVLLEAGWADVCDRIVYVDAPRESRVQRVHARSGWTEAELAAREAAQQPAADKMSRADVVIQNAGTPTELQRAVDRVLTGWNLLPAA